MTYCHAPIKLDTSSILERTYLHFNGNCSEVFNFYQSCFGGDLILTKVGNTPMAEQMPAEMHDKILHCSLANGAFVLYGSDMTTDSKVAVPGTMHSIVITSDNVAELRTLYAVLADGVSIGHEIVEEFFGTYGDLTDKYGVAWMFQSDAKA